MAKPTDTAWVVLRIACENDPNYWEGCEPGWYWGEVNHEMTDSFGQVTVGDTVGPFDTAADAALDMVRSFVEDSAKRGAVN